MTKRLIKIAKELNVGTSTIVDFLNNHGYEIENRPTAKVTEEMYDELIKEFQKSIAIKEQADQLVIGNRNKKEGSGQEDDIDILVGEEEPQSQSPASTPAPPKESEKEAPAEEEAKTEDSSSNRPAAPKLNILGKIDLEQTLRDRKARRSDSGKKAKEKEVPAKPEQPAPETDSKDQETQAEQQPKPEETTPQQETPTTPPAAPTSEKEEADSTSTPEPQDTSPKAETPAEDSVESTTQKTDSDGPASGEKEEAGESDQPSKDRLIKAEAPELRGLKILGKIDTNKFDRPKKKKKDSKEENKGKTDNRGNRGRKDESKSSGPDKKSGAREGDQKRKPEGAAGGEGQDKQKRKRRRRKITPGGARQSGDSGRGSRSNRRDEPKEVSQKEIDEKIKATMARMSGSGKKKRQKLQRDKRDKIREKQELREQEQTSDKLQLTEFISVQELANLMDVPVTDVITTCMNLGVIVSINQRLDAEVIELVASEFDHEVEFIGAEEELPEEEEIVDDPEDLEPRAPIVTVMGHVDHGKTSLLDYIRKANVASGEAGGITQHIGAYEVYVGEENKKVTFLDTPGHEAFTAMRARGAKVTDIAIIIIAADDNIMPQTKEAISHAQAAGVPIVFAINKVDKPGAQPERIKQELANMNLLVEEWGGQYQSQDISAKTGEGIEELLEKITLEAELLELKANPDRPAVGTVIEASLEKGRGYVTKMLVQNGTLEIGAPLLAGEYSGKVRAMLNERGKRIKAAGPSTPVLVLGLGGAPQAGERFREMESEQESRALATKRAQIAREQANRATKRISLDEIGRRLALGNFKELNLIVKGDVDGSVEALSDSLIKLSIETVQVSVIHKAVGQIIESDVLLASASDAIIIGFQVRPSLGARRLAEREGVQIRTYSIIYEAIDEIKMAIEGLLEPTKEERIVSQVEVRDTFKISKVGTIAGCYVQEGTITRNTHIRLIRDGIVVYPTKEGAHGEISSLKRFKDDVREVKAGLECGISIKNFNDIKVGDIIEGYEIVEVKQTYDG